MNKSIAETMQDLTSRKSAEHKREWWATYRAALTGLLAWSHPHCDPLDMGAKGAHEQATESADLAHGKLEP